MGGTELRTAKGVQCGMENGTEKTSVWGTVHGKGQGKRENACQKKVK